MILNCKSGYRINPITGRCIKIGGKTELKLILSNTQKLKMQSDKIYTAYYRQYSVKWNYLDNNMIKMTSPSYSITFKNTGQIPDDFKTHLNWTDNQIKKLENVVFSNNPCVIWITKKSKN